MSDWKPPYMRKQIEKMKPAEIMAEFVQDAVLPFATPLGRFMKGIKRISEVDHKEPEVVYNQILDEVAALTGVRHLPVA